MTLEGTGIGRKLCWLKQSAVKWKRAIIGAGICCLVALNLDILDGRAVLLKPHVDEECASGSKDTMGYTCRRNMAHNVSVKGREQRSRTDTVISNGSIPVYQADIDASSKILGDYMTSHNMAGIFYNRVPKCGSSSLMDLIIEMGKVRNFTFYRDPLYMTFYIDEDAQRDLVRRYHLAREPLLYERHLHFIDFTRFNKKNPVYINIIRDPLERLVSWYYFRRYQVGHRRRMATAKRVRSYDECIVGGFAECAAPMGDQPEEGYFKIIPFFCGQDEFCRTPSEKSLAQAIENVEKHYVIVGTTEDYPKFVQALEVLLPNFFKGVNETYTKQANVLREKHRTTYKLPPSEEAKAIIKPKLHFEYLFYQYVRNRLMTLFQRLGL